MMKDSRHNFDFSKGIRGESPKSPSMSGLFGAITRAAYLQILGPDRQVLLRTPAKSISLASRGMISLTFGEDVFTGTGIASRWQLVNANGVMLVEGPVEEGQGFGYMAMAVNNKYVHGAQSFGGGNITLKDFFGGVDISTRNFA